MTAAGLEHLTARFAGTVRDSVDVLHVAATLESSGITDELAREHYGAPDVFALAAWMRERTGTAEGTDSPLAAHPGVAAAAPAPAPAPAALSPSSVGHGVVYLLPAACIPALLELVGPLHAVLALVVGATVGWFFSGLAGWHAYQLLARDGSAVAAAGLRRWVLVGTAAGTLTAVATVRLLGAPGVVGVVVAVLCVAQLATTLLFFLHRRAVLVVVLLAQAVAGAAHLLAPAALPAGSVLLTFALCTLLLLLLGQVWRVAGPRPAPVAGWPAVVCSTTASVAFLLLPQALLLRAGGPAPFVLASLFLATGFVEWRAAGASSRLRALLSRTSTPAGFRDRSCGVLARESLLCAAVTAVPAGATLLALDRLGVPAPGTAPVAVAAAALAAAYLLALVLANANAFAWLASAFGGATLVQGSLAVPGFVPAAEALVVATGLLLVALWAGLVTRPVHRFR